MSGPYQLVRNPMAVGGALQTIGVGLWIGSWMVVASAFAGAVLWHTLIRPEEEADLTSRFGEPYRNYRRTLRCWLPWHARSSPTRRWRVITTVTVAALVLVALGGSFRFVVLAHWRPALQDGEVYGIDVSAHQDNVDWTRVAADDIDFAYIKATEGGDFTDAQFEANWRAAADAGLERGAYHFFTLCRPGVEQARHFLEVARPVAGVLPPAVDLELAGNCAARPTAADVNSELDTFIEHIEAAWNAEMILYVGDDWERAYPTRGRLDRPLWHHRFLQRPDTESWTIWQIHGHAHIEGINGDVDLNIAAPLDRRTP